MAIPKLALIPSGVKAGKLYSVLPTNGDGDFTTTRNTVATRVNESGLIEEVASNVPRLDYSDGGCPSLLLENSSTNLMTYSEDFTQWVNTRSSDLSGFISPTGGTNGTKVISDATVSSSHIIKSTTFTIASGQKHTYSVFVKANQLNFARLMFTDSTVSNYLSVYFDLLNGTVGTSFDAGTATLDSANIENFGNGWYRCSISGDLATTTTAATRIYLAESDNVATFDGDGIKSIYAFGAQLEQNSYSTSYIKTVGTTQSRSADTANGAGNASTFNDSEGVLMFEIKGLANDGINRFISVSDGTINNRINIIFDTSNNISGRQAPGNVNISTSGVSILNSNKISYKYQNGNQQLWVNGFKIGETSVSTLPSGLDRLSFDSFNGGDDFYGSAKQIQYFDSALNDSDLEKITSWTSFTAMANGQSYTII